MLPDLAWSCSSSPGDNKCTAGRKEALSRQNLRVCVEIILRVLATSLTKRVLLHFIANRKELIVESVVGK